MAGLVWPHLPHGMRGKNFLRHVAKSADGRYVDALVFFQEDERDALYSRDVCAAIETGAERALERRLDRFSGLSLHGRMMHVDFETYLPEDVLTKVDRMSMAHSIESRVPLLDNELIDFAATLPSSFKIHGGRRKHILKEALAPILPPSILERRKQGFAIPLGIWFRGGLTDLFADVLHSARTEQRGYFEPSFVRRLIREHRSGARDHTLRLWQLLVFELWHRQYLDAVTSSPLAVRA
jgi:asparagine synthase (glutamine-hydrolysing)